MLPIVAFITSLVISYSITKYMRGILTKYGIVERPTDKKIHKNTTPTMGGLGFIFSIILTFMLVYIWRPSFLAEFQGELQKIALGAILILIMGILDDLYNLSATVKLEIQVLIGLLMIYLGFSVNYLTNPFGARLQLGILSIPVTLLWFVLVINAINIIDGLDGLAAGVSAIAGFTLFTAGIIKHYPLSTLIFITVTGTCLGFLRYNYPQASIFMGNTGAYLLGYIFAIITIYKYIKAPATLALFLPFLALGVPLLEIIITIFRRGITNTKITMADTKHLHHLLLKLGLPQQLIIWIFYTFSFILGIIAIGFISGSRKLMLVFIGILLIFFVVLIYLIINLTRKLQNNL